MAIGFGRLTEVGVVFIGEFQKKSSYRRFFPIGDLLGLYTFLKIFYEKFQKTGDMAVWISNCNKLFRNREIIPHLRKIGACFTGY